MVNFFETAAKDPNSLSNTLLGPHYSYTKHIKTPTEMGMSTRGSDIVANIDGLGAYVELLFEGGGNASTTDSALGKKFFSKTGAKCKDKKTGNQVNRSIYINTIPEVKTGSVHGMGKMYGKSQGLIPGMLNNIEKLNPFSIFGAFKTGLNPDCMAVTLPTKNNEGVVSNETAYLTVEDIKSLSPCNFSDNINPVSKEKGEKCIEGFSNIYDEFEKIEKIININQQQSNINDVVSFFYFLSILVFILYLLKKNKN